MPVEYRYMGIYSCGTSPAPKEIEMAAKTAAQKIEALLAKAAQLLDEVPGEARWQHATDAGTWLDSLAKCSDDEINERLADYGIHAKADDGVRAGLLLAAALLTNHDIDA
jgi:hypothetical protein